MGMTVRAARIAALSGSVAAVGLSAAFIAVAPWPAAFLVAVAAAYWWCRWLERHPEPDEGPSRRS